MPRTKFDLQWIVEKRMDKVLYLVNREYDIPTKNKKIGNAWNNETTTIPPSRLKIFLVKTCRVDCLGHLRLNQWDRRKAVTCQIWKPTKWCNFQTVNFVISSLTPFGTFAMKNSWQRKHFAQEVLHLLILQRKQNEREIREVLLCSSS